MISRFEHGVDSAVEAAAGAVFKSAIEPAQIAKKAEKQMRRNRLVGAGRQYAPTLYNVLIGPEDDRRLFGFYPTMAAEIETYLMAKASDAGLEFDGRPLVRFIADEGLRKGKFDVIVENVASAIIHTLREEEMEHYGIATASSSQLDGPSIPVRSSRAQPSVPLVGASQGAVARKAHAVRTGASLDAPACKAHSAQAENIDAQPAKGSAALVDINSNTTYKLGLRKMTIGRSHEADIMLPDANASRVHARISQDATGSWKLKDLGSTNGTLLNDKVITQAFLYDGDHITIGITTLELVL
jgi:hypothetical protein